MLEKAKPIRDARHLAFIRDLPCLKTGAYGCEATHLRIGTDGAMAKKPSDSFTVPLTHDAHAHQHTLGERSFYKGKNELVKSLAEGLYQASGDFPVCFDLIRQCRKEIWG